MLIYLSTDLFLSPAQTLVNTVNTVGVMGRGIAKVFKAKYPEMFSEYKRLCDQGSLKVGGLMLWRGADKWVLNFPTKTTWRLPSQLSYVEAGLKKFAESYESLGITSISFPPLGCGNGSLEWSQVKPLMERHLKKLPIPIYIHDRQVGRDFVPEHVEYQEGGLRDFSRFLSDIADVIAARQGSFETLSLKVDFTAELSADGDLAIYKEGEREIIPREAIENAWASLQVGLLTADLFSGDRAPRYASYLLSLLALLPYIQVTDVEYAGRGVKTFGLFFIPARSRSGMVERKSLLQMELWA